MQEIKSMTRITKQAKTTDLLILSTEMRNSNSLSFLL